jgi:hypothetical protein
MIELAGYLQVNHKTDNYETISRDHACYNCCKLQSKTICR